MRKKKYEMKLRIPQSCKPGENISQSRQREVRASYLHDYLEMRIFASQAASRFLVGFTQVNARQPVGATTKCGPTFHF